ncbi:MAG: MaoC/PaaZ C-terminal domain-containing protein [Acidimicrobiales bacterium]
MALPIEKLGTAYGPDTATIAAERAKQYAAATNDDNPAYESGKYAPPVFGVVPTWETMGKAVGDVVPPEVVFMVVHGEQDMHFHQPLVPGTTLTTTSEAFAVRVGGSGTRFVVKVDSADDTGEPVLTQYVTIFIRGVSDGESAGPDKPAHDFPSDARDHEVGRFTVHVDVDQTFRYRDASGDQMPIHVDDSFAKSVGLPGIIAHGLCTLAMCSQAVLTTVADGDPARLRRLAVRFAANVFPGNDIEVALYDAGATDGRHAYAFEATSAGDVVIKNGWAEVEA